MPESLRQPFFCIFCNRDILQFVHYFPNISQQLSEEDVLSCEDNTKIPLTLQNYFNMLFEYIKTAEFLQCYEVEELHEIKNQIEQIENTRFSMLSELKLLPM